MAEADVGVDRSDGVAPPDSPLSLTAPAGRTDEQAHPISPAILAALTAALGHEFSNGALLGRALTHRSWCAEHAGFWSNERLEFLGDAVLGLVVTDAIFRLNPDAEEGQLSRIRASVVCAPALADMAGELHLGEALLLGKGEAASGGRERQSILADAMEAVIGAVYLDGGSEAASALIHRLVLDRLDGTGSPDDKSQLHELVAQDHGRKIRYLISEDGPEHDKTFRAIVLLDEVAFGTGYGRSKKQAEQGAARDALHRIEPQRGSEPTEMESDG